MKSNRRILFLVNSLSGGGAEISALTVAKALQERSHDIRVLAINESEEDSSLVASSIKVLNRKWKSGILATGITYLNFAAQTLSYRPRIVVAHCELPELFTALIPRPKIKLIAVEHTSKPWIGRRHLGSITRKILKCRGVYWVTVSSDEQKIWNGFEKPTYIANPITLNSPITTDSTRLTEAVFVGRLRREKRPEWLISSAVEAGLTADIFGDGTECANLKNKYESYASIIRFHGFIANPWRRITTNSVVVVPSEYEGDGMVVAEAILRGHSVLTADNPDLRRFGLPEENYFLNRDELVLKLRDWKKSGRKLFHAPESIVQSLYAARDINTIVNQWENLFSRYR